MPIDLLRQNRLDGLWNEEFKRMVRYAIMGRNDEKEPSFEWTVRKLIDCRLLGFADTDARARARHRGLPFGVEPDVVADYARRQRRSLQL